MVPSTIPFQPAELVVLIVMLCGYVPVMLCYRETRTFMWFFWGYTFLLLGLIATNAESFFEPIFFQWVEHLAIMLAGIVFLIWAHRNNREQSFMLRKLESFSKGGKR